MNTRLACMGLLVCAIASSGLAQEDPPQITISARVQIKYEVRIPK